MRKLAAWAGWFSIVIYVIVGTIIGLILSLIGGALNASSTVKDLLLVLPIIFATLVGIASAVIWKNVGKEFDSDAPSFFDIEFGKTEKDFDSKVKKMTRSNNPFFPTKKDP
jgi:hypothetical protein